MTQFPLAVGFQARRLWLRTACVGLALAIAAGCGKGEDRPATQVAAKVDSTEITVHQVNAVLARTPGLASADARAAKREALDRLIDRQLAVQQAQRRKLDRSPKTLQAIEDSRAELLLRAFADEVARTQSKPTENDVKKYYLEHPELFNQRRVFALETISLIAAEAFAAELRSQFPKPASMKTIADWLQSKDAKFAENAGVRSAEEIPLQMLPVLQAMKDGEIRIFDEGGGRIQVIRVTSSKAAPVDLATATPSIQQFLFNRDVNEAMVAKMRQLRADARITYMGEFAGDAAEATADPRAKATADALPRKEPPEAPGKRADIVKGIRGLR